MKQETKNNALALLDWLLTHNKNYTKKQFYKLETLKEIINGGKKWLKNTL